MEATRAISTFRWASEVIRHGDDELVRLDTEASLGSRIGLIRWFAFGPVLGITPFNFPLEPRPQGGAVAAGGADRREAGLGDVLLGSLRLAEFFAETDLAAGHVPGAGVLEGGGRDGARPVPQDLVYAGSSEIAVALKGLDPRKRVTLELGGNAGVIVHRTPTSTSRRSAWRSACTTRPGRAASACSGCSCSPRSTRTSRLASKQVESLKVGDPMDPTVDVGLVIQKSEVGRIDEWVQEAVSQGATILTGGKEEPFYQPTLIADVTPDMKVCREEIFGPVVTISPYQTYEEAIATRTTRGSACRPASSRTT